MQQLNRLVCVPIDSEQCALKTDMSIKANPFQYDVHLRNVKVFNGFVSTLKNLLMRNEIHVEIHL